MNCYVEEDFISDHASVRNNNSPSHSDDDFDNEAESLMYLQSYYQSQSAEERVVDWDTNFNKYKSILKSSNLSLVGKEKTKTKKKIKRKLELDKCNLLTRIGKKRESSQTKSAKSVKRKSDFIEGNETKLQAGANIDLGDNVASTIITDKINGESANKNVSRRAWSSEDSDDSTFDLTMPTSINLNISHLSKYKIAATTCEKPTRIPVLNDKKKKLTPEELMNHFYDSEDSNFSIEVNRNSNYNWKIDKEDCVKNAKARQRYFQKNVRPIRCFNCQQWGHLSKSCPEPKKIRRCHLCGDPQHNPLRCKYQICGRCFCSGHITKTCRVTRDQLLKRCSRCSISGHRDSNCPDLWRRYHLTVSNGEIKTGSGMPNPRMFCYNCGSKWHWGYNCLKKRMEHEIQPTTPFIIKYDDNDTTVKVDSKFEEQILLSNKSTKRKLNSSAREKRIKRRRTKSRRVPKEITKSKKKSKKVLKKKSLAQSGLPSVKTKFRKKKVKSNKFNI